MLLVWIFRDWPLNALAVEMDTPRGWATTKLLEALLMVLVLAVGMHYSDVYLQRGRLGLSLLLGLGNGAVMQRSNSIEGAVLAHSFGDVLLLVSIFGAAG